MLFSIFQFSRVACSASSGSRLPPHYLQGTRLDTRKALPQLVFSNSSGWYLGSRTMGVTWLVQVTSPTRDQGKAFLKRRWTGLRRPENRGAGGRGPQSAGSPESQDRRERASGSGKGQQASRARGEAEERGANKPPRLIELYVVQKGIEGPVRSVNSVARKKVRNAGFQCSKAGTAPSADFKQKGRRPFAALRRCSNSAERGGAGARDLGSVPPSEPGYKERRLRRGRFDSKDRNSRCAGTSTPLFRFRVCQGATRRKIAGRPAGRAWPSWSRWYREA